MILLYGGRRTDPDDPAAPRRFPLENVPRVAKAVERFLHRLQPTSVVGSAAGGADLLVLEAAGRLGVRRRVILPFERVAFRALSVADRPGDWGARFDAVIREVSAKGDLVELTLDPHDAAAYERANLAIFREAESLARVAREDCSALALWNGASRGSGDLTEAFLREVRHRGWPASEIDTVRADTRR